MARRGEVRQAVESAARALWTERRRITARALAARACVGLALTRSAVQRMTADGDLVQVASIAPVCACGGRPTLVYLPGWAMDVAGDRRSAAQPLSAVLAAWLGSVQGEAAAAAVEGVQAS